MAKQARIFQKIFGSLAGLNQIGKFGSLAAGAPAYTTDLTVLQSLSNFQSGWFSAVMGNNSPAIEDMNALFYLITSQLSYLFMSGIPEWKAEETYYIGSIVNSGGMLYVSIADDNINNALADVTKWAPKDAGSKTVVTDYTILTTDNFIRGNNSGDMIITLPAIASSQFKKYTVKNIGGFAMKLKASGAELMDGVNDSSLLDTNPLSYQYGTMTVYNNGTTWDVL